MLKVKYQATGYTSGQVVKRYARMCPSTGVMYWCEVGGKKNYDVRQGTGDLTDFPAEVVEAARAHRGSWPSYVEWPL